VATVEKASSGLWSPPRRRFTTGLILIVTLAAFEAMGLGTALPTIVRDLHAEQWYSWPITVFMAASAMATVLAGRANDRLGPGLPLLLGMLTFGLGLVIAGTAPGMPVLLVARALQGMGGGAEIVGSYVLIAVVYPEQHRPAVFGAMSSAWVVPALVGPALAGLITEHLSWRWVFLGLAPLVGLGLVLVAPTLRGLSAPARPSAGRRGLAVAGVGAAVGIVTLTWAAQKPTVLSLALAVVAFAAVVPSLRTLLPRGTLSGRPGIPVMVLARSMLSGTFFGAQAFIPLTLAVVHHFSPTAAGIPLTLGSIGWTAGSLWQSRQRGRSRESLVAVALLLVGAGVVGLIVVAPSWGPPWLVFVLWMIAGAGMGVGTASTAVRVLALSPEPDRGFNSAALQISDTLGQTALVGLGGVLVTTLASTGTPAPGVVPLDIMLGCVAAAGAVLVSRCGRTSSPASLLRPL
jgi:MFS family permease